MKKTVKEQVCGILYEHRGTYYSGQELADRLQVSRTAVWKAINSLRQEGHEIVGSTKLGYAMDAETDLLEEDAVVSLLSEEAKSFYQMQCVKQIDSTNEEAKRQAASGGAEGRCILAEEQTAGKGRRGRSFYSPDATGLYLSILLRPKMAMEQAVLITTAAAVAGAKACEKASGKQQSVGIKWVNDLFLQGKKICGILTEAAFSMETSGLEYAVMGIGFNLMEPKAGWPKEIADVAGSLFEKQCPAGTRNLLAAEFLNAFYEIYANLPQVTYLEEYRKRQIVLGKEIFLVEADGTKRKAKAIDVNDLCQLLVRYEGEDEVTAVSTGEISLRLSHT